MHVPIARSIVGGPFLQSLDVQVAAQELRRTGPVPGMLSFAERALLQQLVGRTWRGDGAIIDGGSFFGSSLVAEAEGLRNSPHLTWSGLSHFPGGRPIHGYELGFLPRPKSDKVDRRRVFGGQEYLLGDDFTPILRENVAPHRELIELHIGDLKDETWPDFPIEIAFIDVCKTSALNAHVSRQFYPRLIGGSSTLLNQDFFFDRLPWIKVTMGFLRDYFRWEGQVFSTSVYTSISAVPQDVADHDPWTQDSYEDCLRYHDSVDFPGVGQDTHLVLAISRAYLMAMKGHRDEALEHLRAVADDFAEVLHDEAPRGHQFRYDRAVRQITRGAGMGE